MQKQRCHFDGTSSINVRGIKSGRTKDESLTEVRGGKGWVSRREDGTGERASNRL